MTRYFLLNIKFTDICMVGGKSCHRFDQPMFGKMSPGLERAVLACSRLSDYLRAAIRFFVSSPLSESLEQETPLNLTTFKCIVWSRFWMVSFQTRHYYWRCRYSILHALSSYDIKSDEYLNSRCKHSRGHFYPELKRKIPTLEVIELAWGPYWGNIGRVLSLQVYGLSWNLQNCICQATCRSLGGRCCL